MNWFNRHPDDLIERSEPTEALTFLRQQTVLEPQQLGKLDLYLHHWVLVLLLRANDSEGVQEMLTLCEIAQDLVSEDSDGVAMKQRWKGFEDLLEGKRRHLLSSEVAAPIQLRHQNNILQTIREAADGRVKQLDLAAKLNLSKGRISQILGVLESRALISRQRQGKESWISLPAAQSKPATHHIKAAAMPTDEHVGALVFTLYKAA